MSTTAGIIFSNLNTTTNTQLTADRTVAAVPFACRYRLVDFALSNMVNAEISNINIVTNYNYRSLSEHIGSGKDWDLARHGTGIRLISPYQLSHRSGAKLYATHLEALCDIAEVVNDLHEEHVVICDSDIVCNVDIDAAVALHEEKGADITMVTVPCKARWSSRYQRVNVRADEESGQVKDVVLSSVFDGTHSELALNIFILNTNLLRAYLIEAVAHNYTSFTRDILMRRAAEGKIFRYLYTGYYAFVADFQEYYARSIELVTNPEARRALLGVRERPVYTNVHNTAPTRYGDSAVVKNSMIADDCVIDGTVENCVLFRGVHVGKGSVLRNSVVLGNTYVGKNVTMEYVVSDKSVLISDGRRLSGCEDLPYFIPKNKHI